MAESSVPAKPKILHFSDRFPKKAQFGEHARLRVVQGQDAGQGYSLLGDQIVIGRDPSCEIVLQDEKASRRHVELRWKKDKYFASDLDSANGFVVNGKRVKATFLDAGDIITIGGSMLEMVAVTADVPLGNAAKIIKPKVQVDEAAAGLKKKRTIVIAALFLITMIALSSSDQVLTFRERAYITFADQDKPEKKLSKKEGKEAVRDFIPGSNPDAPGYKQAQRFFRDGMRELLAKNYRRAISAFETAQTVDPTHNEAKVYVEIARKQLAEEVEMNYRAAISNVKAQRYREAKTYYVTVVRLLEKDPDNKYYQDSVQALKTIEKMAERANK